MGTENELINWEQLDMMADGYTPDFIEIYREFLEQTPELLTQLDAHFTEANAGAVRDVAHKVKGSSANFGFLGVSAPMAHLEQQIKGGGDLSGAEDWMRTARENFEKSRVEVREKRGI